MAYLAILKRFYGPVAVIIAACLAFLLFQLGMKNLELRRDLKKTKAELVDTSAKLVDAETKYSDLIRDYNSAAREAEARELALERQRVEAIEKQRGDYAKRTAQLDRSLQLALDGLRHSAAENSRLALKPQADSPAPCGGYEASPRQLSVRSAEFLVGYGARADSVVLRLDACQRYIEEVVNKKLE